MNFSDDVKEPDEPIRGRFEKDEEYDLDGGECE